MSRPRPSVAFKLMPLAAGPAVRPLAAVAACLILSAVLGGCTTAQIDQIPTNIGGLPEGAPARPATQAAFPAVHDMPPPRSQSLLDEEQQKRLEKDLIAVRNRQSKQKAPAAQNTGQSRNP